MPADYPAAQRLDLRDLVHTDQVPDPYRWLESAEPDEPADWASWRTAWLAGQRDLYDSHRSRWAGEAGFASAVSALLMGGYEGLPTWRGDRYFVMRREPGQQFGVLYVVEADGSERVLIDPIAIDPAGTTTLDDFQPSWEGNRIAYLMSEAGTEESELRVLDVASGEVIDGPIDRARFSPIGWLPGEEQFYYVRRLDPAGLPPGERQFHRRVRLHRIGRDPDQDPEIFGTGMLATNYYSASVTRDGRWLVVDCSEGTAPRNDVYLADLSRSSPEEPDLLPLVIGRDAMTSITIRPDNRMFIWTDFEAPRGQLMLGAALSPEPGTWTPLIPEEPDSVLESLRVVDGPDRHDQYLVLQRTRHSIGELALHDSATGERVRALDVPGLGTLTGPVTRPEGGTSCWYAYTDYVTPPRIFRYDVITGETTLWAEPPGDVRVPSVHTEQVTFQSGDGTDVRMYLISPSAKPLAPLPTLLYGYGGFGISLCPAFNPTALAWVQAGGVYAVANLRGGGEEGEDWHRAGMLANKQNVFDDFRAAARWLIDTGWTAPQRLCVSGGSNGGLLVGAALTQFPELLGAVICTAPLLDMIRYTTSSLGATWTTEYGDPTDPEQFGWLRSYSPYHHVEQRVDYPATLVMVFDNDTRTDPMHGRKMVAALQHATVSEDPILIRTETDVGHGVRSLDRSVAEVAESLAFAAHMTGLEAGQEPREEDAP
ncbi:MAG: prolyl oligopeptidase family serine peptidase [Candidatus Nanopelagicales bacterium]|nr:prolyl oligopeptidase family serine peptidase [Candidatus Nanopelagicales bacterium]MDZ4250543.1 prolyl oligopeptidase family serine peptidase [Candidatus Nanopelagicales bacterium]